MAKRGKKKECDKKKQELEQEWKNLKQTKSKIKSLDQAIKYLNNQNEEKEKQIWSKQVEFDKFKNEFTKSLDVFKKIANAKIKFSTKKYDDKEYKEFCKDLYVSIKLQLESFNHQTQDQKLLIEKEFEEEWQKNDQNKLMKALKDNRGLFDSGVNEFKTALQNSVRPEAVEDSSNNQDSQVLGIEELNQKQQQNQEKQEQKNSGDQVVSDQKLQPDNIKVPYIKVENRDEINNKNLDQYQQQERDGYIIEYNIDYVMSFTGNITYLQLSFFDNLSFIRSDC